jgi:hypothetical protein
VKNSDLETFVKLIEGETDHSRVLAAAESLLNSGARLDGPPPGRLITALIEGADAVDPTLLNLARAWSRPDMSRAMLDALPAAATPDQKEQIAWLLKTVLAVEHSGEAIGRVLDSEEQPQVRRWLLEAVERMTFAGALGWDQLLPVVSLLGRERDPALRAGLASLLVALPWRPSNVLLIAPLLLDDNYEVVSAAAHTLAQHPDDARKLDTGILDHLRSHGNPMMKASASLLEQSIRRCNDPKQ